MPRTFGFAEFSNLPRQLEPGFNIALTQPVPIVRSAPGCQLDIVRKVGGVRELVIVRWGLIPSWAKEASIGNRMINAQRALCASTNRCSRSAPAPSLA